MESESHIWFRSSDSGSDSCSTPNDSDSDSESAKIQRFRFRFRLNSKRFRFRFRVRQNPTIPISAQLQTIPTPILIAPKPIINESNSDSKRIIFWFKLRSWNHPKFDWVYKISSSNLDVFGWLVPLKREWGCFQNVNSYYNAACILPRVRLWWLSNR